MEVRATITCNNVQGGTKTHSCTYRYLHVHVLICKAQVLTNFHIILNLSYRLDLQSNMHIKVSLDLVTEPIQIFHCSSILLSIFTIYVSHTFTNTYTLVDFYMQIINNEMKNITKFTN